VKSLLDDLRVTVIRHDPMISRCKSWQPLHESLRKPLRTCPFRGAHAYDRHRQDSLDQLEPTTGPVWTLDHLVIAILGTLYCVAGPARKERRYLGYYGERFERYRQLVPYWVPSMRRLDPTILTPPADSQAHS